MNASLRGEVRERADDRCEYCQMPQRGTLLPHEADHIRAQKHGGPMLLENLCWACALCNAYKGSDIASYPPGSDETARLFNPRIDDWAQHFRWAGAQLVGVTSIGLATVALMRINQSERGDHRRMLMELGDWK